MTLRTGSVVIMGAGAVGGYAGGMLSAAGEDIVLIDAWPAHVEMIRADGLTIEAPEGYAVLFTHPVNRFDLPFTTLTGIVDCDRYHDVWIHFPAQWRDESFSGVLPRGTPVAQCFPVKREAWTADLAAFTDDEARRAHDLMAEIGQEKGVYRKRFRA